MGKDHALYCVKKRWRGRKTVHYLGLLAQVPPNFRTVNDIRLSPNVIIVTGAGRNKLVRVHAGDLGEISLG